VKSAITSCRFVVAFRIGEGIVLPCQQRQPGANSVQENTGSLQARQVKVAAKVLDQLPDRDVISTPLCWG